MGHAAQHRPLTAAEFLASDESQRTRHEFIGGEIYEIGRPGETQAMAGAGEAHVVVTGNAVAMPIASAPTVCGC